MLRIGAATGPRGRQFDIEDAVRAARCAIATAGGVGFCGVQDFVELGHDDLLIDFGVHAMSGESAFRLDARHSI
ncbi:hypothetical protein D3C73_1419290 [compost metagenome]